MSFSSFFSLPHFSSIVCSQFFSLCHNLSCLNYFAELIRNFFGISKIKHRTLSLLCDESLSTSFAHLYQREMFFFALFFQPFLSAIPNLNFWNLYESNDLIFNWTQILALLSTALQQTEIHFSTKTIFYVTLYTHFYPTHSNAMYTIRSHAHTFPIFCSTSLWKNKKKFMAHLRAIVTIAVGRVWYFRCCLSCAPNIYLINPMISRGNFV